MLVEAPMQRGKEREAFERPRASLVDIESEDLPNTEDLAHLRKEVAVPVIVLLPEGTDEGRPWRMPCS